MCARFVLVVLTCLLSVSLVQGQLYLSATGSPTSTNCSETTPCQNLAQLMQVYEQQGNTSLTIRWAAGSYYGANNTNILLPVDTTSIIESWSTYSGEIDVGVNNDNSAVFTAPQGATVVIQNIPALNCASLRLLDVNNTAGSTPNVIHLLNGTMSALGTVLQCNSEAQGSLLVVDGVRVRGIFNANFQTMQLSDSAFDHTVGLAVKQANVTGCVFTDDTNVFIDEEMIVSNSLVNSTTQGRDITFTYKNGPGILRMVNTIFAATVPTSEGLSVVEGASLSLESVQFLGPFMNAITTNANQTVLTNCTVMAWERCMRGQVQTLQVSQTKFFGCEQVAIGFTVKDTPISASIDNCEFNSTGEIVISSSGKVVGTITDSSFIDPSMVAYLNGDWSLSGVTVGPSTSASPVAGANYAFYFGSQADGNMVSMNNCQFIGPLATNGTLYINHGNAQITNCTFDSLGDATKGGQIFITGNSTLVDQCTFQNMAAGSSWGALSVMSADSIVQNSQFVNLVAHNAAGLNLEGAKATVNGCEFTNCTAQAHGGAIVVSAANSWSNIENSTFVQCGVDAIWVAESTNLNTTVNLASLTFTNCTPYAVDCAATEADVVYTDASLTVTDGGSTVSSNCDVTSAPEDGDAASPHQGSWWQFVLGGVIVIVVSICILAVGAGFYVITNRGRSYDEDPNASMNIF